MVKVGEQRLDLRVRSLLGHGVEELAARPLGFEEAVEQRFELRIHRGLSWRRRKKASNRGEEAVARVGAIREPLLLLDPS